MKNSTSKILILIALIFTQYELSIAQRITVTVAGLTSPGYYFGDGAPGVSTSLYHPVDVSLDASNNIYFSDMTKVRKIWAKDGLATVIGGGGASVAEGVPATDASLTPRYICADPTGNLYLVTGLHKVRKIDAITNTISTIAGTGVAGFSGDGGPAISAQFKNINGICLDVAGNLYLCDSGNKRVRKIDAGTGIVTTIAGNGLSGYTGDGGPATDAKLDQPEVVSANAAGDIFVADQGGMSLHSKIRKIDATTGIITTIVGPIGPGSTILGMPGLRTLLGEVTGLCNDASGNHYFNEISCSCRRHDITTDTVYAEAGNFSIESYTDDTNSNGAWMNNPLGLTIDNARNLYVADYFNNRIRKLIYLTHKPAFAYGTKQSLDVCSDIASPINKQMAAVDLDSVGSETWTVLNSPVNGSLSGFPYSTAAVGVHRPVSTASAYYIPATGFTGLDSFVVRVSDGALSDTTTIYVSVSPPPSSGTITAATGPTYCTGAIVNFSSSSSGGVWSMDIGNASITMPGTAHMLTAGLDTVRYTIPNYRCPVSSTYPISIITVPTVGAITGSDSVCIGSSISMADTTVAGLWSTALGNATVSTTGLLTGVLSGIDTVRYSKTNMCGITTARKVVEVDTTPAAGIITGPDHVCQGTTIALTDMAPGGVWSASNGHATATGPYITGISGGVDTISYTVANACGMSVAKTVINVLPLLPVGPIIGDTTVCIGATITLIDTTPGGVWTHFNTHCSGSGTGSFTGVSVGIDTVLYSRFNACGVWNAAKFITVLDCTAQVDRFPKNTEMSIFPNPASNTLNVRCDGVGAMHIVIQDITGRNVYVGDIMHNSSLDVSIDVSGFEPGLYLAKINNSVVRKFVKQ